MTEIAHGTVIVQSGEAVLPRWWRTVDRVTIFCLLALFSIGILLGFAASTPLAQRNGLDPFHYVTRQAVFGGLALAVMIFVSMIGPVTIRRLGVIGFFCAMGALAMLPVFGTDFGQGATRWYSLGFASVQPAEFLKPMFVVFTAWMIAASQEIGGPPGKTVSLVVMATIVGFLVMQPDFGQAALIVFAWSVIYFVAGAPMLILFLVMGLVAVGGVFAYSNSEHVARRIDGFLSNEIDPHTQIAYATDAIRNGGLFGAGLGEGTVRWTLPDAHTDFIIAVAAEEYGVVLVFLIIALFATITLRGFFPAIVRTATFHPAGRATPAIVTFRRLQAFTILGWRAALCPPMGMNLASCTTALRP